MAMNRFHYSQKKFRKTFYEGEKSFLHEESQKQEPITNTFPHVSDLPTFKFQKRTTISSKDRVFYLVWFSTLIISFVVNFALAHFVPAVSSLVGIGLVLLSRFYTNDHRWKQSSYGLAFWNASVTMSVLLKSIIPNAYRWKNWIFGVIVGGIVFSLLVHHEFAAFLTGLFLLTGLFFFAEKHLEQYTQIAMFLAWFTLLPAVGSLLFTREISLILVVLALTYYQVYERLNGLDIEYPEWIEDE